ncbi:MAG: hypothetical protein ASARMPREDX12_005434 [Alectoria sarmentosa]|nr:MAG: hypothetical protein ASARMPREDX12_005434 [Alectoria sarmentosa]
MAQPEKSLRLVHAPESFCDVMVRANIALVNDRPEKAIHLYTEVLYKLSPAHVCAFLNRSMAYIQDGYYELAVTDAYRACITASELRKNSRIADNRLTKVAKYIRAERLHIDANDKWTRPGRRNIGGGWGRSPLASILISATPDVGGANGTAVPAFGMSKSSIVRAMEIRAYYRLCGTLLMVGGGARKEALGIIDDFKTTIQMTPWESDWFNQLGNQIMNQLVSEVDPSDPQELELLGDDTKEQRDERMMMLKEDGKAATTGHGYGDYPWDPYEPKLGKFHWQKKLHAWVESCSENCSASVIEPETDDTRLENPKRYFELRANRDINSGDLVLSTQTISNVTTSIPEQVEEGRRTGIIDHYYCNSCASLLVVPQQCPNTFQTPHKPAELEVPPAIPTLPPITLCQDQTKTTQVEDSTCDAGATVQTHSPPSSPSQDFMFCRPDHIVPTCSATCRQLSKDFDNGICRTKIEQTLRQSQLNDINPRSISDCKTQCLRDLIFLRHIAIAIERGHSPLRINDLMFATSGPNMQDIEDDEMWSFTSHVVRPLHYLDHLFEKTPTDQFFKLRQLDGWIINTLLVKINRVMRISQSPRYVKSFRADGKLDCAFGPNDERWNSLTKLPKDQEDKAIWIASIDSAFNLIRIADPAKGEVPNVAVVQREGMNVYAINSNSNPAIKAGEPLLRAADGGEGLVADERLDMDEKEDAEEAHSGDTSDFLGEVSNDEVDMEDVDGDGLEVEVGDAMEVDGVGL